MNKLILVALAALALASCGVRGDPEAPPSFQQNQ
jgi:predicted small lipoprotein YifL